MYFCNEHMNSLVFCFKYLMICFCVIKPLFKKRLYI